MKVVAFERRPFSRLRPQVLARYSVLVFVSGWALRYDVVEMKASDTFQSGEADSPFLSALVQAGVVDFVGFENLREVLGR